MVIRNLGLNDRIHVQYFRFLNEIIHGNLGLSYYSQVPVRTILAQDLPITAPVAAGSLVLWLAVGLTVGVISPPGRAARSRSAPGTCR
jgi:peptide/nickel transport system permease protein